MPSAVEDRRGSRRQKAKGQRQEIAATTEDRRAGRPGRSTDVHSMHRVLSGRPAGRPKCCLQEPNSRVFWVDRWVNRKRSVDLPVDRQSGLGEKLLLCRLEVFKPNDVSRVWCWEKELAASSLAFKETKSYYNYLPKYKTFPLITPRM